MLTPTNLEELCEAVIALRHVRVLGGGTKPSLSNPVDGPTLCTRSLTGVTAYDPGEYTFTALAGTPVQEIHERVGARGQFLPCSALPQWPRIVATILMGSPGSKHPRVSR